MAEISVFLDPLKKRLDGAEEHIAFLKLEIEKQQKSINQLMSKLRSLQGMIFKKVKK